MDSLRSSPAGDADDDNPAAEWSTARGSPWRLYLRWPDSAFAFACNTYNERAVAAQGNISLYSAGQARRIGGPRPHRRSTHARKSGHQ